MIEPVRKAMERYYSEHFGNPASMHIYGEKAREAVDEARVKVARVINADPEHIYFTSSATEANNIIVSGFYEVHRNNNVSIVYTNSEHPSILEPLKKFPLNCYELEIKPDGTLDTNYLQRRLLIMNNFHNRSEVLVSIITANNEIGTIHDLKEIGRVCGSVALFHTDATQAIGKVKIDVQKMGIDALTFSGHKIYGPKGVGVLYLRDIDQVKPIICGGYQNIVSSGTQNVPAIVGLGVACENLESEADLKLMSALRDKLLELLRNEFPDLIVNGTMENRLPNNLNVIIPGVPAEPLLIGLDDVLISSGSACGSGKHEPSHVIKALGVDNPECAIRFGLGRLTDLEQITYAATRIIEVAKCLKR